MKLNNSLIQQNVYYKILTDNYHYTDNADYTVKICSFNLKN